MKRIGFPVLAGMVVIATGLAGLYLAQPSPLAGRVRELERELGEARSEIVRLKAANKAADGRSAELASVPPARQRVIPEWEETRPDRLQVEVSAPIMEAEGAALSPEQQAELLNLITSVRRARPPLPKGTQTAAALQQQDAEKLQILQQAARFLTPLQLEKLKKTPIAAPR
ncbi:MAG TPA: hypothetical protein VD994_20490 [Prosthecobacter sp.]|nr:hypothetical protein [Prosthecobacter sp.]